MWRKVVKSGSKWSAGDLSGVRHITKR